MKKSTLIISIVLTVVLGFAALVLVAVLHDPAPSNVGGPPTADIIDTIENDPPPIVNDDPRPEIHGLLSYVEYGDNRAYIFGSMHVGRPDFFPLADVVEQAMRRADTFAFEYDLTLDETLEGIVMALYFMILPDDETLATYLPPEAYAHLLAVLETFYYIDYELVEYMRPAAIDTLMMYFEIAPALGVYAEYSVDEYVFEFAFDAGLPVLGLASMEHQLSLGFDLPHEVSVASVMAMPNRNTLLAQTRSLVDAYVAQNINALRALVTIDDDGSCLYNTYFVDIIMTQRTSEFAQEIDRLLRETDEPTTFFITIGIAHLLHGHGNAFEVLEELGHTVNSLWR